MMCQKYGLVTLRNPSSVRTTEALTSLSGTGSTPLVFAGAKRDVERRGFETTSK